MTIITKFGIGDDIAFIKDSKLTEATIIAIRADQTGLFYQLDNEAYIHISEAYESKPAAAMAWLTANNITLDADITEYKILTTLKKMEDM